MPSEVLIIPAILATTPEQFQEELVKIKELHKNPNNWVHIDFMDNIFVPNKSIRPSEMSGFQIPFKKEAHLMVQTPTEVIHELISLGFTRIILHIESESFQQVLSDDIVDQIAYLKSSGVEFGLAVKLDTPVDKLLPYLNDVDVILMMAIEPGFQGRQFRPEVISRIKEVTSLRQERGLSFSIEVDGGVGEDNAGQLVEMGVDRLVIGSHLLKGDINENFQRIQDKVKLYPKAEE